MLKKINQVHSLLHSCRIETAPKPTVNFSPKLFRAPLRTAYYCYEIAVARSLPTARVIAAAKRLLSRITILNHNAHATFFSKTTHAHNGKMHKSWQGSAADDLPVSSTTATDECSGQLYGYQS